MHFSFKRLISGIIIVSFLTTFFVANIETTKADVYLDNAKADKALLEAELAKLEKEIAEKEKELAGQKGQSVSLSRDIAILTSQIQKSKLDIKAKNLVIQKLGGEISNKNQEISALSVKIDREKESLAQLLRKERMINDRDIISLILSKDNISDVYGDIEAFSSIKKGIQESISEIRNMKDLTETEKLALEKKKDEETDTKYELERDKAKVETSEAEKQRLLSISKNKEAEYQKVLQEKAQKRAQILAAIFSLAGGGSTKINFETALVYAREAQKLTGIDPAFLLAVLTQESNLGANVGQCYLTDTKTGAGMNPKTGKTYPNVMKPMGLPGRKGDIDDFFLITAAVGRDPYKTLVSCPIAGVAGYGGAMGPAQFIPSTWGGYKNRLKNLLGLDADPWNPRDAFMASATYLTDLGAVGNSASAQHKAACRYYGTGGTTCSYSNSVMRHKLTIQANIDLLQD
ncbi:MAG TPA: lytic murein transglycosylase [Candidatus Paceibacterota bacterium]|mgnify:FL=1|nr:lytic murein transglycosylase [Candidatus Paceibacterota bacterium]